MVDSPEHVQRLVGIEISGTALNAVVIGENDAIIATRTVPVSETEGTLSSLIQLVDDLKTEFTGFDRIGIAVPGLVDRMSGRVAFSANIPKHSDVDLVNDIRSATGVAVL